MLPKTYSASSGDLDRLLQQAAEYLYGEANILAFSMYLDGREQYRREVEYLQSHINRASEADRVSLFVNWAIALVESEGMSRLPQSKSHQGILWDTETLVFTWRWAGAKRGLPAPWRPHCGNEKYI